MSKNVYIKPVRLMLEWGMSRTLARAARKLAAEGKCVHPAQMLAGNSNPISHGFQCSLCLEMVKLHYSMPLPGYDWNYVETYIRDLERIEWVDAPALRVRYASGERSADLAKIVTDLYCKVEPYKY